MTYAGPGFDIIYHKLMVQDLKGILLLVDMGLWHNVITMSMELKVGKEKER